MFLWILEIKLQNFIEVDINFRNKLLWNLLSFFKIYKSFYSFANVPVDDTNIFLSVANDFENVSNDFENLTNVSQLFTDVKQN